MQTAEHAPPAPVHNLPKVIWVACPNHRCPQSGARRQVFLRAVAVGVVELPRLACQRCGWELPYQIFNEPVEELMPKIHADRDPTYKTDIPDAAVATSDSAEVVADTGAPAAEPVEGPPAVLEPEPSTPDPDTEPANETPAELAEPASAPVETRPKARKRTTPKAARGS